MSEIFPTIKDSKELQKTDEFGFIIEDAIRPTTIIYDQIGILLPS